MKTKLTRLSVAIAGSLMGFSFATLADTTTVNNEETVERVEVVGQLNKFSALKSDTPLLETARSVSIETAEQMLSKGAFNLDDALSYSAGVIGNTFGFSTRGDFENVRGFDVPEYRDGMQSLSGFYNNTRTEVYTLEQVEVLKGPASVLFGPGSPGGIINVVSKYANFSDKKEVSLDVGSFNRKQLATDITFNSTDDTLSSRVVALYRDSDTQISQVNDDSIVIMPSVTYRPSDVTEVTVIAQYNNNESDTAHQFLPLLGTLQSHPSGHEIQSDAYLGQPGWNQYDTESYAITLLAEHQLNETWSLDMSSRYRSGDSTYRQTWIAFMGDGVPRVDANGMGARSWYGANNSSEQFQFDLRARAEFEAFGGEHKLLMGTSSQTIESDSESFYLYGLGFLQDGTPFPQGGVINVFSPSYDNIPTLPDFAATPTTKDDILGVYVHNTMTFDKLIIGAGLRFDSVEKDTGYQQSDDSETSISVSAMYQLANGLSPYVNYSESFEPVPGADQLISRPLKPRYGEQTEAGIKWQPVDTDHMVNIAYFDIKQNNMDNPAALINAPSQQEGSSTVTGIELESIFNFNEVSVEFNATSLDAEDPNGFEFASIPESMMSVWVNYAPESIQGLRTAVGTRYVGENSSTGLNVMTGQPMTVSTDAYQVFDVMLGYAMENWDFNLTITNLTDEDYLATCLSRGDCYPGEARRANLRATYSF